MLSIQAQYVSSMKQRTKELAMNINASRSGQNEILSLLASGR